jgi:hypothetical protein
MPIISLAHLNNFFFFITLVYFYATIRVRDIVCKLHVQQYSSYMVTVSFIVGKEEEAISLMSFKWTDLSQVFI